jgi:3-dehydroquinate synthetase
MKSDKKNKSDSINLILIRNFGKLNLNYQAKSGELNKFLFKELNKAYL